ncbi:hypothetical protein FB451DRAFT_1202390 [Mycena latifolia]|nr:hypothetical protein FB451DRAFT_1202390 [Mycena latifolia]
MGACYILFYLLASGISTSFIPDTNYVLYFLRPASNKQTRATGTWTGSRPRLLSIAAGFLSTSSRGIGSLSSGLNGLIVWYGRRRRSNACATSGSSSAPPATSRWIRSTWFVASLAPTTIGSKGLWTRRARSWRRSSVIRRPQSSRKSPCKAEQVTGARRQV